MRALAVPFLLLVLAAPGGAEEWTAEDRRAALVGVLPFEPWEEVNRVVVDLAPEGTPRFPMMLDTGAGDSVMTPLMARSLGVSVRRQKSSPYRRKTSLGRDVQFWVDTSTSDSGSKTGWEYGLLGGEFLEDFVFEIDFPGRTVSFFDRKRYGVPKATDAPDEIVVPLRVTAKRPFTKVAIDGTPVQMLVDTGAPLTGWVSGKVIEKVGIDPDGLRDFGRVGFVLGTTEARLYEARSLAFGAVRFEGVPLMVVPKGSFNLAGATDSALGYDLLSDSVVRFDYRRKRMLLRKTAPGPVRFYGADYPLGKSLGAMFSPIPHGEKSYYVWDVDPEGPAHAYGLREGDRIVAPYGEERPTMEDVASRIREGGELTVARKAGDIWADVALPEAPPAE